MKRLPNKHGHAMDHNTEARKHQTSSVPCKNNDGKFASTKQTHTKANDTKQVNLKTQVQQVQFNKGVLPLSGRQPTPMELFLYHSQATAFSRGPGR